MCINNEYVSSTSYFTALSNGERLPVKDTATATQATADNTLTPGLLKILHEQVLVRCDLIKASHTKIYVLRV